MATTRSYWNEFKASRDAIIALMGGPLISVESRIGSNGAMATAAMLAKILVDKGLITDTDLQNVIAGSVATDGSLWDQEPIDIPIADDATPDTFDVFPGEGFETGVSGTDVTGMNTAFTAGQVGDSLLASKGTATFDSAQFVGGAKSLKTAALNGWSRAIQTNTYATTSALYARFYFRAAAGPPSSGCFIYAAMLNPALSGHVTDGFGVGCDSTGFAAMFDNGTGRLGASTPNICNGSWWRVEAAIYSPATCELRLYTGANLHTTTITYSFTGIYNAGAVNVARVGQPFSALSPVQSWTTWHDDVAFSTSGWVGP